MTASGLERAAAGAARGVRASRRNAFARALISQPIAPQPIAERWPDELPRAWVAEAARSLAEACIDIPGVIEADISIRDDTRRISVFDVDRVSASRRERSVSTAVRCSLADGREIRASVGRSGPEAVRALPDVDDLPAVLREQAEARPIDGTWDGVSVPVVLEAGWCAGTWLHEAVGHFFEADNVAASGTTLLQSGARVAGDTITITDDPRMPAGRGTIEVDDEGVTTRRTVLVAEGVVQGYLHSRQSAMRREVPPTGNGRRQDFRCIPIPRMTNLVLESGPAERSDLLESVSNGLLVRAVGRASLDVDAGRFALDVLHAHPLHGGSMGEAVTGFRLRGDAATVLAGIKAVANDFRIDPGRGDCLKRGQVARVGAGSPSILVEGLTVHVNPRCTSG